VSQHITAYHSRKRNIKHITAQHSTAQHSTAQHSTAQHRDNYIPPPTHPQRAVGVGQIHPDDGRVLDGAQLLGCPRQESHVLQALGGWRRGMRTQQLGCCKRRCRQQHRTRKVGLEKTRNTRAKCYRKQPACDVTENKNKLRCPIRSCVLWIVLCCPGGRWLASLPGGAPASAGSGTPGTCRPRLIAPAHTHMHAHMHTRSRHMYIPVT
jgi:hypothetical protein